MYKCSSLGNSSLMAKSKKEQVKNIQSIVFSRLDDDRRYLNGHVDVLRGLIENRSKNPKEIIDEFSKSSAQRSDEVLDEINLLLVEMDPIATLGQIVVRDSILRNRVSASDAFGSDVAVEFLAGLVTSLNDDLVSGLLGVEFDPFKLNTVETLLREFANLQDILRFSGLRGQTTNDLGLAQLLLKMESLFDRTEGYPDHLKRINRSVFEPLSDLALARLGFKPLIVLDLVEAEISHQQSIYNVAASKIESYLHQNQSGSNSQNAELAFAIYSFLSVNGATSVESGMVARLAAETGHSLNEVTAALESLTLYVGSQPPVRAFGQELLIQNKPIIKLSDGRSLWFRPVDFSHEALNWFYDLSKSDEKIRVAFNKSRQESAPQLVYEILSGIFGDDKTFFEPTYESEGSPDLDVLALFPHGAVLAEVKAGHFTPAGRAGLPERLKKKIKELYFEPLFQVNRAARSIFVSPDSWKDKLKRTINLGTPEVLIKIIVTLENLDSVSLWAQHQNSVRTKANRNVWLISLSNLMMVADVLQNRHEFLSYAADRMDIFQAGRPLIGMESDILNHWITDRIKHFHFESNNPEILAYGSDDINHYFTLAQFGLPYERPKVSVPVEVTKALDFLYENKPREWFSCVRTIYEVTDSDWDLMGKYLRAFEGSDDQNSRDRKRKNRLQGGVPVGGAFYLSLCRVTLSKLVPQNFNLPCLRLILDGGNLLDATWIAPD